MHHDLISWISLGLRREGERERDRGRFQYFRSTSLQKTKKSAAFALQVKYIMRQLGATNLDVVQSSIPKNSFSRSALSSWLNQRDNCPATFYAGIGAVAWAAEMTKKQQKAAAPKTEQQKAAESEKLLLLIEQRTAAEKKRLRELGEQKEAAAKDRSWLVAVTV